MNCVILQPSYIPWRGYFHQVFRADVFVFYDDVQYDKRGWRNRNRVKTPQGSKWLTIPVQQRHGLGPTEIRSVEIDWRQSWNSKHWMILQQSYNKAPFFRRYRSLLEHFFCERHDQFLADLTIEFTMALATELGITHTRFLRSSTLSGSGRKTERLISLLSHLGATHYISGPSAQDYIEADQFRQAGIDLEYIIYDYPEYPQLYPPFDPQVSILDLLLMTGPDALQYITKSHSE